MSNIVDELKGMGMGRNVARLIAVATGAQDPPRHSRLGAFKAVLGHAHGTVGHGAARAIAGIYILMGDAADDNIGDFFHSDEVQALLDESACGPASLKLAQLEHNYWGRQHSIGGFLGTRINPTVRQATMCGLGQL